MIVLSSRHGWMVLSAALMCIMGTGSAQHVAVFQSAALPDSDPLGHAQIGVISTGGAVFGVEQSAEVVKGEPYQAEAHTEIKQTLADGSHITQSSTAQVARDSKGRTARIQKLSTIGPWRSNSDSDQSGGPTLMSIFDPVANEHIDYTSDSKVAHVMTLPTLPKGAMMGAARGFAVASADGPGPAVTTMFSVQGRAESGPVRAGEPEAAAGEPEEKTESLGNKAIDGIQVNGTRSTTTIPAGSIGNDKDIVVTRETWYSPDLKLVLMSIQDDPRFGKTTYTLTSIDRSEPDKSLFQVPSDYKIEKMAPPALPPALQANPGPQ